MTYDQLKIEWESDSPAIKCCTSGSTGTPSEIILSKEFLLESAIRTNRYFNISSSSLLYSCIAADYIGGKMMLIRSQIAGAKFLYEKPSNQPLQEADPNTRIDLLSVVPSQLDYILDNIKNMPEIGTILVGGAPLSYSLKNKVIATETNVFESYGMTETASHIALRKVQKGNQPFKILEGIKVDEEDGRLKIIFKNNNYQIITNDIVQLISDTEFYILGRIDNIINSGGIKISIEKLESLTADKVENQITFTSVPDSKWGEALVMVVEGGLKELLDAKKKLAGVLTHHLKPKHNIWIKKMPLTSNGKLNRHEIKEFARRSCKIL